MPDKNYLKFASALYKSESGIVAAILNAPDDFARQELEQAESVIRREIRRQHLRSPEEDWIFVKEDGR